MTTESVVWLCETAAPASMRVPKAGAAQPKLGEHPHPKKLRYAEAILTACSGPENKSVATAESARGFHYFSSDARSYSALAVVHRPTVSRNAK